MFERMHEPLAPFSKFLINLLKALLLGITLVAIALFIGMLGYHYYGDLAWIDSFLNASMILSGMGPVDHLDTTAGKLFSGFYALFSGLAFIMIIGLILAPIVHRFLHSFHLEKNK